MREELKTGYPHKDKMWLKYYDSEFLKRKNPCAGIYDYMKAKTKNIQDYTALSYFGKKVLYGELYENIDYASRALTALGVKKNDRIMYLMPNIPETAYLMYGTTQIGAVADYVDPRPDSVDLKISAKKILDLFVEEKSNYIIALDQCYLAMIKPIEKELKELGIENIVVVSASDSMDLKATANYMLETANFEGLKGLKNKLANMKKMDELIKEARKDSIIKVIDYRNLVRDSRYIKFEKMRYEPNKLDLIVHTSGTSSPKPKAIPLTNDNLNSYVHQTFGANMVMNEGDKALHMLPYFAAYGVVDVTHAGLCHGNNLIQIPEFSPANLGKLIKKYKPQTIIGTPTWFLNLMKDKNIKNVDLEFLKMITYGGDTMEYQDEIAVNEFLKAHNCNSKITKGHGMSETCGCASFAIDDYNIPRTMGIPMPSMTYGIVDPETKKLIKFEDGQDEIEGELIISGPTVTSGVLDGKVIVPHYEYDDMDFILTRDIAKMNRDGIMEFLERKDRSFTRFDGFKVKPHELENMLKQDPRIKYCVVSPYFDEEKMGNMSMATIVLNSKEELCDSEKCEIVNDILNKYFIKNSNVSSRQIPTMFKFKDELPQTKMAKIDYNAIINEGITGDEVEVVLEETNISIGNIQILPPKNKKMIKKK